MKKIIKILTIAVMATLVIMGALFFSLQSTVGDAESQLASEYNTVWADSSDGTTNTLTCQSADSQTDARSKIAQLKSTNTKGCISWGGNGYYEHYYNDGNFIVDQSGSYYAGWGQFEATSNDILVRGGGGSVSKKDLFNNEIGAYITVSVTKPSSTGNSYDGSCSFLGQTLPCSSGGAD